MGTKIILLSVLYLWAGLAVVGMTMFATFLLDTVAIWVGLNWEAVSILRLVAAAFLIFFGLALAVWLIRRADFSELMAEADQEQAPVHRSPRRRRQRPSRVTDLLKLKPAHSD